MKINQISLFLENKPGALNAACRALANSGINIQSLALADTEEFGILRLIVDEWRKARAALEDAGYATTVTEVLAVPVEDRPGAFAELMEHVAGCGLNLEYLYTCSSKSSSQVVLILRFEDNDKAMEILHAKGVNIFSHAIG